MKKQTLPALLILLVAASVFFSGCAGKKKEAKNKKIKATAHVVTVKEKQAILDDAKSAIMQLEAVRDETAALPKFLSGVILKQTAAQIETDNQAGKTKVRVLKDIKLELKNYTNGVAGVSFKYIDGSYYIDTKTGSRLTEPTNKPQTLALALKKLNGKWKIFGTYSGLKPDAPGVKKNEKKAD